MLRTGGRLSICLHRPTRTIKSEQAVYDFGLQGFWEEVAQSNGRTRRRDTYTVKLTKLLSRVPSVQHLPLPGVLPTPSYIQVGRRAAAKPGARALHCRTRVSASKRALTPLAAFESLSRLVFG